MNANETHTLRCNETRPVNGIPVHHVASFRVRADGRVTMDRWCERTDGRREGAHREVLRLGEARSFYRSLVNDGYSPS